MANVKLISLINIVLLLQASAEFVARSYDEIDPIVDMLMNGEYGNVGQTDDNNHDRKADDVPMLYPDGVWRCGNCTDMTKLTLLYSEVYDHDTNYDDYMQELNTEIQIGLAVQNMSCITLEGEDSTDVRLVSGACAGEYATLGIIRGVHCVVSVYGLSVE